MTEPTLLSSPEMVVFTFLSALPQNGGSKFTIKNGYSDFNSVSARPTPCMIFFPSSKSANSRTTAGLIEAGQLEGFPDVTKSTMHLTGFPLTPSVRNNESLSAFGGTSRISERKL